MSELGNFLVTLGENIALLFALTLVIDVQATWLRRVSPIGRMAISGIVFSVMASAGMLLPVEFMPGITVDLSVVIVALSGALIGWKTGVFTGLIVSLIRIYIGGTGVLAGTFTIVAGTLIGLAAHRLWFDKQQNITPRQLLIIGFSLAIQTLIWTLLLPSEIRLAALQTFTPPVLLMYPLATWLVGIMLLRERSRRQAEAYWKTLVENAPGHILLIKQDGTILFSSEPMSHPNLFQLIATENHDRLRATLQTAINTGQSVHLNIPAVNTADEIWNYRINAIDRTPGTYLIIGTDLTAYQQTIDALIESETQYRSLVENSGTSISVYNPKGELQFINAIGAAYFNREANALIGQSLFDIFTNTYAERCLQHIQQVMETDQLIVTEDDVQLGSQEYYFLNYIFPMRDSSGNIHAAQIVSHDVTERKAAEEARRIAEHLRLDLEKEKELRELKSGLFSMFSHDFKNPMTSITMSVSILEKYGEKMDVEDKNQKYNSIYTQLDRMKHLIDDVLTLERLDSRAVNFHPIYGDLAHFCRQVFVEMKNNHTEHNLVYMGNHKPLFTYFDQHLMERALVNVISNAVKYSNAPATVSVSIEERNSQIVIAISDNGIGIPVADQHKLFEIFERGSNVGSIKGTGLGLAIVKQVIDLHQGEVTIQSEVNKGTTFTLTLPVVGKSKDQVSQSTAPQSR